MAMSDAIAVMSQGKVMQFGTPREIYDRPANRYVASFIGHAHIVDATIESLQPDSVTVRLRNGDRVGLRGKAEAAPGSAVGLMLRAEDLAFADAAADTMAERSR